LHGAQPTFRVTCIVHTCWPVIIHALCYSSHCVFICNQKLCHSTGHQNQLQVNLRQHPTTVIDQGHGNWNFRTQELSFPGTNVHKRNFCSLEHSSSETFIPWNFHSWELLFPTSKSAWNLRSITAIIRPILYTIFWCAYTATL